MYMFLQNNCTPLHLVAWNGHITVLDTLIKSGADINAKSNVRMIL